MWSIFSRPLHVLPTADVQPPEPGGSGGGGADMPSVVALLLATCVIPSAALWPGLALLPASRHRHCLAIGRVQQRCTVVCSASGWPAGASFEEGMASVRSLPEEQARALRLGALRRLSVIASLSALQRLAMLQEKQTPKEEDVDRWAQSCESEG